MLSEEGGIVASGLGNLVTSGVGGSRASIILFSRLYRFLDALKPGHL